MFASILRRATPVLMAAPLTQQSRYQTQQTPGEQETEPIQYEAKFRVHITDALLNALMGRDTRTQVQHSFGGVDFVPVASHPSFAPGQSFVDSSVHAEINAPDTPYSSPSTTVITTDDLDESSQYTMQRTDRPVTSSQKAYIDESSLAEALERGRAMGREEAYQELHPMLQQAEAAFKQSLSGRRAEERQAEVAGLNQLQKDMAMLSSSSKSRPIKRPVCENETNEVLTCYRKYANSDPIKCSSVVHAYSKCAEHARNRTATE